MVLNGHRKRQIPRFPSNITAIGIASAKPIPKRWFRHVAGSRSSGVRSCAAAFGHKNQPTGIHTSKSASVKPRPQRGSIRIRERARGSAKSWIAPTQHIVPHTSDEPDAAISTSAIQKTPPMTNHNAPGICDSTSAKLTKTKMICKTRRRRSAAGPDAALVFIVPVS